MTLLDTVSIVLEPFSEPTDEPARHTFSPGDRVRVTKVGWAGEDVVTYVRGDHVAFGSADRRFWFRFDEVELCNPIDQETASS